MDIIAVQGLFTSEIILFKNYRYVNSPHRYNTTHTKVYILVVNSLALTVLLLFEIKAFLDFFPFGF
jgi:hypothetical protein